MRTGLRLPPFVLGLAVCLFAACESAGYQKVDATATRMRSLRDNLTTLKTSVTSSADSLGGLVDKADVDPKPSFDQYQKDVRAAESAYDSLQSRFNEAKTQAYKVFGEWSTRTATISDADLKKLSEERRADLTQKLDKLVAAMQPAMEETQAYISTSKDLVEYLSLDLTPRGIKAISDKAKAQMRSSTSIADKLDDAITAADAAASEFATAKPPPPEKASTGSSH